MKILVASENPVKLQAVDYAFSKFFENVIVKGIKIDSGVPAQPIQEDTFLGAENRARNLYKLNSEEKIKAEYFVGIEGGVAKYFGRWYAFGCMFIMDSKGKTAFGTSPHFELPDSVVHQLLNGKELGDVIDVLADEENTKQNYGAIGFLTNGVMDRKFLYVNGLITALVPFLNKDLYFNS